MHGCDRMSWLHKMGMRHRRVCIITKCYSSEPIWQLLNVVSTMLKIGLEYCESCPHHEYLFDNNVNSTCKSCPLHPPLKGLSVCSLQICNASVSTHGVLQAGANTLATTNTPQDTAAPQQLGWSLLLNSCKVFLYLAVLLLQICTKESQKNKPIRD